MKFVEFHKRGEIDKEKMVKRFPEKILKFLLLQDPIFQGLQSSLASSLQTYLTAEQLLDCRPDLTAALLTSSPVFRAVVQTKLIRYLNRPELDILSLEEVAEFLCALVKNCDKETSENFLEKVENNINVVFVKEELINFMTVKIKLRN